MKLAHYPGPIVVVRNRIECYRQRPMWCRTVEASAVLTHRAAALRGTARVIRARSRSARGDAVALIARSLMLRGAPALSGSSDGPNAVVAGLITSIILDRPTCAPCIAEKAGVAYLGILRTLTQIGRTIRVTTTTDRCRACGALGPVYSLRGRD